MAARLSSCKPVKFDQTGICRGKLQVVTFDVPPPACNVRAIGVQQPDLHTVEQVRRRVAARNRLPVIGPTGSVATVSFSASTVQKRYRPLLASPALASRGSTLSQLFAKPVLSRGGVDGD